MRYNARMIEIRLTDVFSDWLDDLRDDRARVKITARVRRLALGNPGDVAPVGEGVSELRIHYGPGYRVYFIGRGSELIIILGGGDKSTQDRDIVAAKELASQLEESP
jgi:putative addiction module killer protein